jgi:hypothetical protein
VKENEQVKVSVGDGDQENWENISYGDVELEEMADPFKESQARTTRKFSKISDNAKKFKSWTLKQIIIKANDDVR